MLLFDPQSWKLDSESWTNWHRRWFRLCLVLVVAAGVWCVVDAILFGKRLRGSSRPGLAAGSVAGLLFLYLCAYAARKWPIFRWWFRGRPTKFWLGQHIWFGLLTFPLVLLHTCFFTRWGGWLPSVLLAVYFVVFASGVWGLWIQQRVPRRACSRSFPMRQSGRRSPC